MKTPIYITLNSFIDSIPEWKTEPSNIEELKLTPTLLSNDRYYYRITIPKVDNLRGASTSTKQISFAAHRDYRESIRFNLLPTVGFGKNSCYKVEFWKWNKVISSSSVITKLNKTKLLTEYWLIPNTDGYYYTNYQELKNKLSILDYNSKSGFYNFSEKIQRTNHSLYISYDSLKLSKIKRVQVNAPPDSSEYTGYTPPNNYNLPNDIDAVGVFKITDWEGKTYLPGKDFIIKDTVKNWNPPLPETVLPNTSPTSPIYQIQWLVTSPVCYRLEYPLPLTRAEIIYRQDDDAVLADYNYSNVFSSLRLQ